MQGRTGNRRLLLAILGGASGTAVLVGLLVLVGGGGDGGPMEDLAAWSWTFPLAALFVILGVTWLLLSQTPADPSSDEWLYAVCPACGRSVMRDWRLCPYCGEMLEEREPDACATPPATDRSPQAG